jgi:hypothetical protein
MRMIDNAYERGTASERPLFSSDRDVLPEGTPVNPVLSFWLVLGIIKGVVFSAIIVFGMILVLLARLGVFH